MKDQVSDVWDRVGQLGHRAYRALSYDHPHSVAIAVEWGRLEALRFLRRRLPTGLLQRVTLLLLQRALVALVDDVERRIVVDLEVPEVPP
jgi:hypothetical protein